MIYECIANTDSKKFVMAKPKPAIWSGSELTPPFEIVYTLDLQSSNADYDVVLIYSWGQITVLASQIDFGLVVDNNG